MDNLWNFMFFTGYFKRAVMLEQPRDCSESNVYKKDEKIIIKVVNKRRSNLYVIMINT
jgi:hypothetical protein